MTDIEKALRDAHPPLGELSDEQIDALINESREKEWTTHQHARAVIAADRALQRVEAVDARRLEALEDAMHKLQSWAEAYPLSVFPEPDMKSAHEVLTAAGMTLDAISASNMRHVITQVKKIADAAIAKGEKT